MLLRSTLGLLAGLVGLIGCRAPVDLTDDLNDYASLYNAAQQQECTCYLDLGFQTLGECYDTINDVSQLDIECLDMALDGHEDEGQEYLDCINQALGTYNQCLLVDVNTSCEPATIDSCMSAYTTAIGSCTQLPPTTKAGFDACVNG